MKTRKIIAKIVKHVGSDAGKKTRRKWYAEIASDPEACLFNRHHVDEDDTEDWTWPEAQSTKAARKAEKKLLALGFDGGPGGGDKDTHFLYAYRKTSRTSS